MIKYVLFNAYHIRNLIMYLDLGNINIRHWHPIIPHNPHYRQSNPRFHSHQFVILNTFVGFLKLVCIGKHVHRLT